MDIGVIIDDSVSVFDDDFLKEKEFIYRIYQKIDPSPGASRVAVAKFSSEATLVFKLSDPAASNQALARKQIDCLSQSKGGTCIDQALNLANDVIFSSNETRKGVPQLLILITDGACNCAGCAGILGIANNLKQKRVDIMTIGVGYGIDEEELRDIASRPHYFLMSKGFDELLDTLSEVIAVINTCNINATPPTVQQEASQAPPVKIRNEEYPLSSTNEDYLLSSGNDSTAAAAADRGASNTGGGGGGGASYYAPGAAPGSSSGNGNSPMTADNAASDSLDKLFGPEETFSYMNPIIVNIQTCPNSKVHHIACKPASSRCFRVERDFLLEPSLLLEDQLCRCSGLALRNKFNFFSINDKGHCQLGVSSPEYCSTKRSLPVNNKKKECVRRSHFIYRVEPIVAH